jgi:hypothetical protein
MGPATYQLHFKRFPRLKILQNKLEIKLEFKTAKQKIEKNKKQKEKKRTHQQAAAH